LSSDRIGCDVRIEFNLLVKHLVKIFLIVSRSVIGLVILILFSQAVVFGMGYIDPLRYSVGIVPVCNISLKMVVIYSIVLGPSFLIAIYGICEGPGAELLCLELITLEISSMINGLIIGLYQEDLI
jgi:hypothetical protein